MYLKVNSTVKYDSGLTTNSASVLKSTVTNQITSFGDTNLKTFDKSFRYSKLIKEIDESEISIKSLNSFFIAIDLVEYLFDYMFDLINFFILIRYFYI